MFRHGDWITLWNTPVPFTQKQLREDIDTLVKRYRALGLRRRRASRPTSTSRRASIAPRRTSASASPSTSASGSPSPSRATPASASSTLQDKLTLFARGSYDDYEVGASADAIQRYYQQQGYFFARVDWRRDRLSADEERIVRRSTRGRSCKVRGIEFVGNARCSAAELAEVVSVRHLPVSRGHRARGGYVTGKQLEQDVERLVEHYHARGFLEAKAHVEAATVAGGARRARRDRRRRRDRLARGRRALRSLHHRRGSAPDAGRRGASAAPTAAPSPTTREFLLEQRVAAPRRALRAADGARRRPNRLERLLGDAGYPTATVEPGRQPHGQRRRPHLGAEAGAAHAGGPDLRARQLRDHDPDDPRADPARHPGDYLTTTPVERSQRNLGFLQLFNNATPISFPGMEDGTTARVVPMVVDVEERYEQYSVLHFGAGASTDQKAPDSSFPFGVYAARRLREPQSARARLDAHQPAHLRHRHCCRANVGVPRPALPRHAVPLRRLAQLSAAGDGAARRHPLGRRLDRLFARDVPGRRRRACTTTCATRRTPSRSLREAGPNENTQSVTLGDDRRQRLGQRRVAAPRQPAAPDARLSHRRDRRAGAAGALRAAAAVPFRHRRRLVPQGGRPLAVGRSRSAAHLPARTASASTRASRSAARRSSPRSSATSPAATRPSAATSSIARASRSSSTPSAPTHGRRPLRRRVPPARRQPAHPAEHRSAVPHHPALVRLGVHGQRRRRRFALTASALSQFRHGVGVSPLLIRLPIGDVSFAWAWPLDPGPGDTRIGVFHVNVGLMF